MINDAKQYSEPWNSARASERRNGGRMDRRIKTRGSTPDALVVENQDTSQPSAESNPEKPEVPRVWP